MAISRPAKRAGDVPGQEAALADATFKAFPVVWAMLSDPYYDDGASRQLSALSFFLEDGVAKLALNDREERRSLYVAGESLKACLTALEAKLSDPGADWRAWGKQTRKK